MKAAFILNPAAGSKQPLQTFHIIDSYMKERTDIKYKVFKTSNPSNATEIATKAAQLNYDIAFAVGGDGTANEVAAGLVKTKTALGIIPCGSGNDFAKMLNIPFDIIEAIEYGLNCTPISIDSISIGDMTCLNIASVGIDAETVLLAAKYKKMFKGASYVASLVQNILTFKSIGMRVEIDGVVMEGQFLLSAIANGKQYGGKFIIAPDASVNDGLIDICLVKKVSKYKLLRVFPLAFKGEHGKLDEVMFFKAKEVKLTLDHEVAFNLDGNLFTKDGEIVFKIEPSSLLVACKL